MRERLLRWKVTLRLLPFAFRQGWSHGAIILGTMVRLQLIKERGPAISDPPT